VADAYYQVPFQKYRHIKYRQVRHFLRIRQFNHAIPVGQLVDEI